MCGKEQDKTPHCHVFGRWKGCKGWKWEVNVRIKHADTQREQILAESPRRGAHKTTACFQNARCVRTGFAR